MRWIFWFLLLSNIALLGWRFAFHTPPAAPVIKSHDLPHPADEGAVPLRLIGELNKEEIIRRIAPTEAAESRNLCVMAGPFADPATAEQFIARLAALDVNAFVHPVELSAGEGYWVYLDPLSNREMARRRLAELHVRGIDSYIIPKGELENGISLGVFTRRDLAEGRLQELENLGLTAKIQAIDRSYREVWVMLGEGEERKLADVVWQELLRESFSLQQRQNLCSPVASNNNFH